jgi:ELWxxDGT repeat protein
MKRQCPAFSLAAALVLPAVLPAAPYLVQDLSSLPYPDRVWVTTESRGFDPAASYFAVDDLAHGTELWRSDGTPGGTERMTDVCPGRCDSWPSSITVHAGRAFFMADDGFTGMELWVSDGTQGSERRLRDLCPGPCSAWPGLVEEVGGRLLFLPYFPADPHRAELWQTDGTREGTVRVKTLCTGGCSLFSSLLPLGAPAGRALFFVNRPAELELWVTDGTAAGTRPFHELGGDFPPGLVPHVIPGDGFAWVWASDGLWRTDGTAAGTFRLKRTGELARHPGGIPDFLREVLWHGLLFGILGEGEIIRSDGTPEGTFRLAEVPDVNRVSALAALDREILFTVDDEERSRSTLWSSRGTVDTTGPQLDLGPAGRASSLAGAGNRAVFHWVLAGDFEPTQLWVTDGTAAGTRQLAIPAELTISQAFFPAGDRAFFLRDGYEDDLWITDGTEAGTHRVKDFGEQPGSSGPLDQAALGGKLVFSATTSLGRTPLFVSDGTAAGTELLSRDATSARSFFRFGNRLLFSSTRPSGYPPRTWATDGTPDGTVLLGKYTGFSNPALLGGQILFSGFSYPIGIELWKTNGLPRGVDLVKDIDPFILDTGFHHTCEAESSSPVPAGVVGGRLLFAADDGRYGRELWASDGTPGGTVRVRDINPGRLPGRPTPCEDFSSPSRPDTGLGSNPEGFVLLGSVVLFTADDGTRGRELWISNGTFPGTHRVADLIPGPRGSAPHDLVRFHDRVYFLATNAGSGESLWQTDGTAQGTVRVRDLALDGQPSWGRGLTVAGDRLVLTVYNETTGAELWTSRGDATHPSDTGLLIDLNPGPSNAAPQSLIVVEGAPGVLLFAADDGLTGLEPWRTDGTAAGTRRLGDIAPGRDASSPGPFTATRNLVMTGAGDGVHGRELWAIPKEEIVEGSR